MSADARRRWDLLPAYYRINRKTEWRWHSGQMSRRAALLDALKCVWKWTA